MSKQRDIKMAVKAALASLLPTIALHGFDVPAQKPTASDPGGDLFGHPESVEVVETELSPLTYHCEALFPIELAPPRGMVGAPADIWIDQIQGQIGTMVANEAKSGRFGGLIDWAEVRPAEIDDQSLPGVQTLRWSGVSIAVLFCTDNLLN